MVDAYSIGATRKGHARPALPALEREAWASLHASQSPQASPFLHPAYAEAVACGRDDVEVAVLSDERGPKVWLPYLRRGNTATPIGGRMSDTQGPLVAAGTTFDVGAILRGVGLRRWTFERVAQIDVPQGAELWRQDHAAVIDLHSGFEGYAEGRKAAGSRTFEQSRRKARKLAREVGALRFEWHDPDPLTLTKLFQWKAEQRLRTATPDVFAEPWAQRAVARLLSAESVGVRAQLCSLWAGERLAASHLGLASDSVLSWWVTSYDPELGHLSPGLVMLVELIRAAAERGYERIDLGPGDERYKGSLATGAEEFCSGEVDLSHWRGCLHRTLRRTRERIRVSPLEPRYAATKAALRRLGRRVRGG